MAWAAKLLKKERERTHLDLVVEFTDGLKSIEERFRITGGITLSAFKDRVRSKIAELEAMDQSTGGDLALGDIDLTVVPSPRPSPPPKPAQIAEEQWRAKYERLQRLQFLVDRGIISSTFPAYATLQTEVQNDFLPSYFANL